MTPVGGRLSDQRTGHLSGTVPSGCIVAILALTHLTWGVGQERTADQVVLTWG